MGYKMNYFKNILKNRYKIEKVWVYGDEYYHIGDKNHKPLYAQWGISILSGLVSGVYLNFISYYSDGWYFPLLVIFSTFLISIWHFIAFSFMYYE